MEKQTIMMIAIGALFVIAIIVFIIAWKHGRDSFIFSGLACFISILISILLYNISSIDFQKQSTETSEGLYLINKNIEKTFSNSLKESVESEDLYISKDDIFYIDIVARGNENERWWRFVEADIGSTIEFCIRYENTTSDRMTENILVRASLPDNMEYVDESATLYNETNPKGLAFEDPCEYAVNIGHYAPNGNAELRFKAIVTDTNLEKGRNELRVWAKVTETKTDDETDKDKTNALLQYARVYVEK